MESQKLKTQKLKCYVLGPKSQKCPTAENTRYTVYSDTLKEDIFLYRTIYNPNENISTNKEEMTRYTKNYR